MKTMMNSEKHERRNLMIMNAIKHTGTRYLFTLLLAHATLITLSAQLRAHEVWVEESEDGNAIARFAEYGNDPETSPGHLDSLDAVVAWTLDDEGKSKRLEVTKKSDHFALGEAALDKPIMLETGFPVMASANDAPSRKPFFYARWQASLAEVAEPALNLDIVPTGEPGVVRVYFRNEPLANIDVTLFCPDPENDQDLTSDEDGYIRFTTSDKGLHMIKLAHHREEQTGYFAGSQFGRLSHNMSLTWIQE